MDQGVYTAAAGAMAMELRLAVIANNLANVDTVGFKKDHVNFEKYVKQLETLPLAEGEYQRIAEDVITKEYYIDTSQGSSRLTSNPLDVALIGDGYFAVSTEGGERYTRAGSFQRSIDGLLIDQGGNPIQGEGGDIQLGTGDVIIASDGTLTVGGQVVDKLKVVDIPDDQLVKSGRNLFEVREGYTPVEAENAQIQQGTLEMSNVNAIKEMLGLVETQRAYELFQKMIRTENDAYGQSIRNVGTVS
jgi:flagellar basal-body rod protein FlgG